MIEREWIDVEDWNLRSMTPGASVTGSSWGSVETDERGAVIRVSGRWVTGQKLEQDVDPETGVQAGPGRLVPTAVQGEHPTREVLLAHGYEDRAEWPLDEADAERDIPQPKAPVEVAPERHTAETTYVEPQDRSVVLEKAEDLGEMGAPVDVEAGAAAAAAAAESDKPEEEVYKSPFTDAPPAGTPASDSSYNPPEGAPVGEAVEDLVKSGRAEVLDT